MLKLVEFWSKISNFSQNCKTKNYVHLLVHLLPKYYATHYALLKIWNHVEFEALLYYYFTKTMDNITQQENCTFYCIEKVFIHQKPLHFSE